LAESNVRFAIRLANHTKRLGAKTSREELVGAANVGLVIASKKFDPREGRFTTYAAWWITKEISEHVRKNESGIDIPQRLLGNISKVHKLLLQARTENRQVQLSEIAKATDYNGDDTTVLLELINIALDMNEDEGLEEAIQPGVWSSDTEEINSHTVFRAKNRLFSEGRKATAAAIAQKLGFPANKQNIASIEAAMKSIKDLASETVMVPSLFSLSHPESLEEPIFHNAGDEATTLEEITPSPHLLSAEIIEKQELLQKLRGAVVQLGQTNPRGAEIIGLYFGLNAGTGPLTLEEIGVCLNPRMPYASNSVGYQLKKALAELKELMPDIVQELAVAA
jgi:RNA polymerase sigma factor (sigma-70 family)